MFELVNGFRKTMYWSKKKMEAHAIRYSAGYRAKKGYTYWEKDFDGMAYKTMLRQLISKWGIMSIDLQNAFTNDMSFKQDVDDEPIYFDNSNMDLVESESSVVYENAQETQDLKTEFRIDLEGNPTLL